MRLISGHRDTLLPASSLQRFMGLNHKVHDSWDGLQELVSIAAFGARQHQSLRHFLEIIFLLLVEGLSLHFPTLLLRASELLLEAQTLRHRFHRRCRLCSWRRL